MNLVKSVRDIEDRVNKLVVNNLELREQIATLKFIIIIIIMVIGLMTVTIFALHVNFGEDEVNNPASQPQIHYEIDDFFSLGNNSK